MPRCKTCKEMFKPQYFLQKYCMDKDECIKSFSEAVAAINEKAKTKKFKEETAELKEKVKTLSQHKKDLEKEINLIVRLIDKDKPCMMCSNPKMKRVNACHYHSVGANDTLRFNLFNIWAGCHKCNSELGGNIHGYDMLLIEKQGRENWEYVKFELTRTYKHLGLTIPEIKELTLKARKIGKELKLANLTHSDNTRWELRDMYNKQLGIYKH